MKIDLNKLKIHERFIYEKFKIGLTGTQIYELMRAQLPNDHVSKAAISQTLQRLGLRPAYKKRGQPKKT